MRKLENHKINHLLFIILIAASSGVSCSRESQKNTQKQPRVPVDTIGFATESWQMDSVLDRIVNLQQSLIDSVLINKHIDKSTSWKVSISPHDDYSYVGYLYPLIHQNLQAKTVILFGVFHKAGLFNAQNQIIFDGTQSWAAPYGDIEISEFQNDIISQLPQGLYQISDTMHAVEHSIEGIVPFLQYYNKNVQIIPILVPFMSYEKMDTIGHVLAKSIAAVVRKNKLDWGNDLAIVISSDAVHYGDKGWGGGNFAYYGTDEKGYQAALAHETEIIDECFNGGITPEKIKKFVSYTTHEKNFKAYKWTWCGRYSIPCGLLTAWYLQEELNQKLIGLPLAYSNSISQKPIPVHDLNMGETAPANSHHWVGYATVGYRLAFHADFVQPPCLIISE